MMITNNYSVDDEFGNPIPATGLDSYGAALQVARRYLSEHDDAPSVDIYTDEQSWTLTRREVLG